MEKIRFATRIVHHPRIDIDDRSDRVEQRKFLKVRLPDLSDRGLVVVQHVGCKRPGSMIVAATTRIEGNSLIQ